MEREESLCKEKGEQGQREEVMSAGSMLLPFFSVWSVVHYITCFLRTELRVTRRKAVKASSHSLKINQRGNTLSTIPALSVSTSVAAAPY